MLHHRMRRAASALIAPGDGGSSGLTFLASTEQSAVENNDLTVTMPTNSDGDYIFVWFVTDSSTFAAPITAPSGWTTIDQHTSQTCALFVKTASSEPASYLFQSNQSETSDLVAIALSISSPTGYVTGTIQNDYTTNSITMPSDGMVIVFGGRAFRAPDLSPPPSGLTAIPTGMASVNGDAYCTAYYGPASAGTVSGKTLIGADWDSTYTDCVMIGVY